MSLPTLQKSWVFSLNNRITFVSLIDTLSRLVFGVKNYLKTQSYTVKGSCDGTTGAMDGVDRIASQTNFQTRATIAGAAQSWIVLTDGSGVDILITYLGSADDKATVGFSPGGRYVAAGTANQKPTATDEQLPVSGFTMVGVTASGDRVWSCMVDSTHKMFRVLVARAGVFVGAAWGVEIVQSRVTSVPFSPPVWGFSFDPSVAANWNVNFANSIVGGGGYIQNTIGGLAFANNAAIQCSGGLEMFGNLATFWGNIKTELQGSSGYPIFPWAIGCASAAAANRGPVGNLFDWWLGRTTTAADGDVYGANQFITTAGGMLWPWDGATNPVMT
jgi:hypothetical protein